MENGSEHGHNSVYLAHFEVSNNFAWRGSRPQEIEQRRAMLDDLLIFDILLRSGGVRSPDILYPPRDEPSLIRLLEAIENSNYDALKKDCLIYFLLKWHQDGREDKFAMQRCIPPQFCALADAYWHLDSGINLPRGVSVLADVRLNRDFASKILQAISLAPGASALIRKYVRSTKPPLTEPDDIELFTLALADSSLLEAWQYQRTFHESNEIRPRLLQKILEWCVSPKPRPTALVQLLSLPLSAFEESTLHAYICKPSTTLPPDALPLFQDLISVRLIQLGRYVDAIRMDREFTSSKVGANTRQAQDRSKMVQDLYDALPAIERAFIDAELSIQAPSTKVELPGRKSPAREDVDMAQSWEEIRPSDVHPSTSKLPVSRPIPERANAPRFGGPIPTLPAIPAAPQLPTVPNNPSVNSTAPRSSFPLSTLPTTFPSPSGSRPRHSLSNTAGCLALGTLPHISSPLSGTKFPAPVTNQVTKPSGKTFISANQQPNAFYTPPSKVQRQPRALFPPPEQPPANGDAQTAGPEKADDEHVDEEGKMDEEMDAHEPQPLDQQQEQKQDLGFSIFGNDIQSWMNIESGPEAKPAEKLHSSSSSMKRKVPGSFGDDEDEDMEEGGSHKDKPQEEEEEVATARTARSKQSVSARSTTSRGHKKARSKRTESKDPKRRRSSPQHNLPGALVDDDAEEDQVAPLRSVKISSRKFIAASTGRLSRGSTASDLADELAEGVQTRRRSSRLSATVSGGNVGEPEVSPKKSARTRKPTSKASATATGTRKKRT